MKPSQDYIVGAYSVEVTARWIEQQGVNAALKRLEELEPAIAAYATAAALRIGRELSMHNLPRVLVTDEPRLLAWCQANLPAAVVVEKHVLRSVVKEHVGATGELPTGAELAEGGEKFYIK